MSLRYRKSINHLKRAEEVIPLGSQTFSKSRAQFMVGASPLYASHAKGAYLWDIDGNRYIDLINNLASVTLGYADSAQNRAVIKQLRRSTGMSLPAKLEAEVAEKIIALVPSAEMLRFAKNGTDATSAAVRLSRAYTGRERVAVCGYHGWQDWFIGSTNRSKGVPKSTQELTHLFNFNDLNSLQSLFDGYPGEIACVIIEPMNREYPTPGYLESLIALCELNGAICVFDETITGFRFSRGGAQELFGVRPHLSTFGKGIANGYPLSVVCGRRDIMMEMEQIFFSGTFGGELLSLAAANYVLDKHLEDSVCGRLKESGLLLRSKQEEVIKNVGLEDVLSFSGHPSWVFYEWSGWGDYTANEIRALFLQELYASGVLIIGTNNISLSFSPRVNSRVAAAFEKAMISLERSLRNQTLPADLRGKPPEPVLRIR